MLPIHTVLYPTDFSNCAEDAFPIACSLAWDVGARLVTLHVIPNPIGQESVLLDQRPEEFFAVPLAALHTLRPPRDNVCIESQVAIGSPAEQILKTARGLDAGIIVIGSHGRFGIGRVLLGSVAECVIRDAPCPVLAVKGKVPFDSRTMRLLVATDLSSASAEATRVAFALARGYHCPLTLLHVSESKEPRTEDEIERQLKQIAEVEQHAKSRKRRDITVPVQIRLAKGNVVNEIDRAASELGCNLVVMGTHGRSGVRRALFGSVAESMLRHSNHPLLLVRSAAT